MKPNVIELPNSEIEDDHLEKLVNFLANKEMVKSLNLRRNKIGNKGAEAFAEFITNHDQTLVEVDLNRNRIEEEGA